MIHIQKLQVIIFLLISFVMSIAKGETDKVERAPAAVRNNDIAVITFKDFSHPKAKLYHRKDETLAFNNIKKVKLKAVWQTPDIFNSANREKCNSFKRIFIPYTAFAFSPEMYDGMTEYVKNGGLLITNNVLSTIDVDNDSKIDWKNGDKNYSKPGFHTIGVFSPFTIKITNIEVVKACPITAGLPVNKKREVSFYGRYIRFSKATPLVIAEGLYRNTRKHSNSPLVTFMHQGKGACIFLGPRMSYKNEWLVKIFNNTLSQDTLEWLTAGDK